VVSSIERGIDRITGSVGLLAAWLVAPLVLATCYEVFSRYVMNDPTLWAYEVGYMATGTNFLLGIAYTLRERGHIRIDVLYSHFSDHVKAIIDAVGIALFLLPAAFWLSLKLWTYAYDAYLIGETTGESAWNPVVWPFRSMFFLGFVFLSLQGVGELIKSFRVISGKSRHPSV
jgi:TRAP-type mannitol/chloroaromatic compound transport system permease small subunit